MEKKDLALYEAIGKSDIQKVINAIKAGANVNSIVVMSGHYFIYKWRETDMHVLAYTLSFSSCNTEIIKLLIDSGAKIDDAYTKYTLIIPPRLSERSKFTNTLCHLTAIERAAKNSGLEIIKYMVDKGANPTCYNSITYNEETDKFSINYNTPNKTYTLPDGGEELEQYQWIEKKIRECKSNKDITKVTLEYPQYMVCLAEKRVSLEKRNKNILEYLDQATVLYNSQIRGKDINHI